MHSDLGLEQLCGQLLVVGFPGDELPSELRRELEAGRRGGVILFKRNVPDLETARSLAEATLAACPNELPPFVSVDQEGGRVARLKAPFVELPPMRRLGERDDEALVERVASVLAEELGDLGFNLDYAPVLDVDSNPENPVIGDRAFGRDAERVARLGAAFVRGLQGHGVLGCGKHFPGHGDTDKDSHLDLPAVTHDAARLRRIELPPFRAAIEAGVATLMSAHVVYEGLDPGVPATLSHRIANDLLRDELGFGGVLFSDDLEMKALADRMTPAESAVGAIRAGCDALLVCSSPEMQNDAVAAVTREAERDAAFQRRCIEAFERGISLRRRCPPRPLPAAEARKRVGTARARALELELA